MPATGSGPSLDGTRHQRRSARRGKGLRQRPWLACLPAIAALLLQACAVTGPGPQDSESSIRVVEGSLGATSEDLRQKENIYQLLVAEFAGHRGQLDLAVSNYLDVAKRTRDPDVAERAARIGIFAQDYPNAIEAARIWSEARPDNIDAHRTLAALYVRTAQVDAAVQELNTLLQGWDGDTRPAYATILAMLSQERDKDVVLQVMARFLDGPAGQDMLARLTYADLAVRAENYDLAADILTEVLKDEPDNSMAMQSYARVLQAQGKVEEAIDYLQRLLQRNPGDDASRSSFARLLVNAKRFDEAIEQFQILKKSIPENNEVSFALALVLLQTNRFDEAREELKELLRNGVRVQTARYYLGQIAESREQWDLALAHYLEVDRGQYYLDAQIRAAVVKSIGGHLDEARAHIHGIRTRTDAEQVRLFMVDGELLTNARDYAEAMAVYTQALEEFPENTELLYARAMVAEKVERIDILEQDLLKILSQNPTHAQALNALGYTLADRTQRYDEAYGYIRRALEQKPDDYFIQDSMGWVLYRMGRIQEALEYLQRASDNTQDAEVAAHLGEVLWMSGQHDEARAIWEGALQREPNDLRVLDAIRRLDRSAAD